eukprot:g24354.t1
MRPQPGEATKQDYLQTKQHKQQVIDRAKQSHNQRIRSKLCSPATSSHEWWCTIKQLAGGRSSINIPILNVGGTQKINAKDKAEAFTAIFSQKYQVDDPSQPPLVFLSVTNTSLQPILFTPCDINKWLETLDTAKAMGPDSISAIVLKTCAPELATPLVKLFQHRHLTNNQ